MVPRDGLSRTRSSARQSSRHSLPSRSRLRNRASRPGSPSRRGGRERHAVRADSALRACGRGPSSARPARSGSRDHTRARRGRPAVHGSRQRVRGRRGARPRCRVVAAASTRGIPPDAPRGAFSPVVARSPGSQRPPGRSRSTTTACARNERGRTHSECRRCWSSSACRSRPTHQATGCSTAGRERSTRTRIRASSGPS